MSNYRDDFRAAEREAYWSFPRLVFATLMLILALYVVGFVATGGDLFLYRFWAPKRANAEREVFESTQSYVQGKAEYLSRLRFQFQSAAPGAQKDALRTLILSESATVDNAKLPADLQTFIASMRGSL